MGIDDIPEIDIEKIKSEMRIIVERIKNNENKMNKAIKFRIRDIYYDLGISQVPDKELLSEFYYTVGMGYQLLNGEENKSKALEFLQQTEDLFENLKDYEKLFEVYNEMGIIYQEIGKNKQAYNLYEKGYDLAEAQKLDDNKKSAILVNLASINSSMHNYEKAIAKLEKALKLFIKESITSHPKESSLFLANTYFNLGSNFLHLLEFDKALENFKFGHEFMEYPDHLKRRIETSLSLIRNKVDSIDENKIELILEEINS